MAKPFQVLVLGGGSHAGKSLVAAGLCRLLSDRGLKVAPFKAQNMALNSAVADDGAEIGRAQWLQALAARCPSDARMNPVLLKPVRGQGSQVILKGKACGVMSTAAYFRFWPKAAATARAAYQSLAAEHQALVMEGAGSPAEVNLAHRDLANLETARFSGAPWILVVDIERGGSFASAVGTLALVPAWLRRRFLGVVFNKFRGDVGLMKPGLAWLKRRGIPCLGIVPFLDGLVLEEEDSLGIPLGASPKRGAKALRVQVLRHRHAANFNDVLALSRHPQVQLDWVRPGQERARPDLLILPGSKDSLADMSALSASGEGERLKRWRQQGTWVLGLCGGFQMLGKSLADAGGADSGRKRGQVEGLGLLDVSTHMGRTKVLASRDISVRSPWGALRLRGYEIHHGRTRLGSSLQAFAKDEQARPWIFASSDRRVWGSYLHGLLDHADFADAFLGRVATAAARRFDGLDQGLDHQREQSLQTWAKHLQENLDLRFLPSA